jgi:hypothetical protein
VAARLLHFPDGRATGTLLGSASNNQVEKSAHYSAQEKGDAHGHGTAGFYRPALPRLDPRRGRPVSWSCGNRRNRRHAGRTNSQRIVFAALCGVPQNGPRLVKFPHVIMRTAAIGVTRQCLLSKGVFDLNGRGVG